MFSTNDSSVMIKSIVNVGLRNLLHGLETGEQGV